MLVSGALFLARSSGDIADRLGVSSGVIGVALLAVTTSLRSGPRGAAMVAGPFAVSLITQTVFELLAPIERRVRRLEPDEAFRILDHAVGL